LFCTFIKIFYSGLFTAVSPLIFSKKKFFTWKLGFQVERILAKLFHLEAELPSERKTICENHPFGCEIYSSSTAVNFISLGARSAK